MCSINGKLYLDFPYLSIHSNYANWKMNVKKILSEDCFIKFSDVSLIKVSFILLFHLFKLLNQY
jgi:hypothetical protein